MNVPFGQLNKQYLTIKSEIDEAIANTIKNSSFVRGPEVDKFEPEFAQAIGSSYCVSCANGTDALFIAMKALGAKYGDEVITTSHSWISTSSTISQTGADVVFTDTTPDDFTIDVSKIEQQITEKTVGIVPVHLFGKPADMDKILEIADKYGLWVVEDCAQSHLAVYKNKTTGTIGNAGTFSFYPGKNLGAMGDAGAVVTNDENLATKMAMIARHGGLVKGNHEIEGVNSRMDGMQAAILRVKLKYLEEWTRKRQEIADYYANNIKGGIDLVLPRNPSDANSTHAYHLYVIRVKERDKLAAHLKAAGIQTVINYPTALPFLPAYERYQSKPSDFPNSYKSQNEILSIPLYPELTNEQIMYVVETINNYY